MEGLAANHLKYTKLEVLEHTIKKLIMGFAEVAFWFKDGPKFLHVSFFFNNISLSLITIFFDPTENPFQLFKYIEILVHRELNSHSQNPLHSLTLVGAETNSIILKNSIQYASALKNEK